MAVKTTSTRITGPAYVGNALSGYLHTVFRINGYHITKINLQVYPGLCKVVLTIGSSGEGPLVCFMNADTLEKAIHLLEDKMKAETLKFYPDKFALAKLDKTLE